MVLLFQRDLAAEMFTDEATGLEGTRVFKGGKVAIVWDETLESLIDLGGGPTPVTALLLHQLFDTVFDVDS